MASSFGRNLSWRYHIIKFPYHLIDLTHTLDENTPSWDGSCGFKHEIKSDYDCSSAVQFRVQQIKMNAGIGTHLDAPAHCVPGACTIDELQLSDLIAPCAVIDVSQSAHERYSVSPEDIRDFEKNHGAINPGTFIMIKTGWERFWSDSAKYHNNHFFPSVSNAAAELLLERRIVGLGIDTLSPDRPEDGYPVHATLLGAGKYIIENAANLSKLPAKGSFILALPIKIKGGTEAPMRLIGLIDQGDNKCPN